MAKIGLIIVGIVLLIATFFVLQVAISPNDKSNVRTANSLCNSQINAFGINIPIGEVGQKVLGKEQECKNAHYMVLLLDYGFIGYIVGGIFLLIGLLAGIGGKAYHEEKKHSPKHSTKFCGECGSKLEGHEKHCAECGAKV